MIPTKPNHTSGLPTADASPSELQRATIASIGDLHAAVRELLLKIDTMPAGALAGALTTIRQATAGMTGQLVDTVPHFVNPSQAEQARTAFINEFQIKPIGAHCVSLTLNEGQSRIDFIEAAQSIWSRLTGHEAVLMGLLTEWRSDGDFINKLNQTLTIAIDGNVPLSTSMSEAERDQVNSKKPYLCDLACAHLAFLLATGKDLFGGNAAWAKAGALYFDGFGSAPRLIRGDLIDRRTEPPHCAAATL